LKMNTKYAARVGAGRILRSTIIALASAFALTALTGCFGSPRANDTVIGGALGAGAGYMLGGSEGSPGTGALLGGLGGAGVGYLVGTETEHYYRDRPWGYYGGY
jgi:Glycine zipper